MSKTMYYTPRYFHNGAYIVAIEVTKVTEHFATYMSRGWGDKMEEHREAKKNNFFDTWQEAKDALVAKASRNVDAYKARLHEAKTQLGMMESLKP